MGRHIAILCMALNIGGAETHIFELAKGLKEQGHTVTVFSGDGVYANALKEVGVRHIEAPLNKKTPAALWRSYRILKKAFRAERPSVVHSHTRISNFVAGLICRRMGIPMVTTVHFNFRTDPLFRLFSNWGCRSLAVSDDLREYLIRNYRYDPDRVEVTVNGIDTARFCKRRDDALRAELSLAPDEKMILTVTRLDPVGSRHLSILFRLAPDIYAQAPKTRIVVVGDGRLYQEFAEQAEQINRQCGVPLIRMQGAQTHIERYTAAADLFVGVSRSALEAMASELPTVLLGNAGYLGLYTDQIRKECIRTNLTCRGLPYPSDSEMVQEIVRCITADNLSESARAGRALVLEHYSLKTMVTAAERLYTQAIDLYRPLDYMISGYYGSDNFGDNLTLSCLMRHLTGRRGSVLTHNVQNTSVPDGVQKIHRFSLWQIRKAMKKTKVFLLGSGSILQDATSNRSLFYYYFIMKMAVRYHCKTLLYANGIGPITRPGNRRRTAAILNKMDLITVRDTDSIALLEQLGITRPAILTADDSFSYYFADCSPLPPPREAEGRTVVGINFKMDPNDTALGPIADALRTLAEAHGLFYCLIPFHHAQDEPVLRALHRLLPEISYLAKSTDDPQLLIRHVAAGSFQIFERLHGQIMATMLNTPYLPISYDPKIVALNAQMGISDYMLNHDDRSFAQLVPAFERILADQEIIRQRLADYTRDARERAQLNQKYLNQMITEY